MPCQLFLVLFASNPSAPPLMLSGSATGGVPRLLHNDTLITDSYTVV